MGAKKVPLRTGGGEQRAIPGNIDDQTINLLQFAGPPLVAAAINSGRARVRNLFACRSWIWRLQMTWRKLF